MTEMAQKILEEFNNMTPEEYRKFYEESNKGDQSAVIPLDISDDDFLVLAKMAHEQDITFNQLINNILRDKIQEMLGIISQA